MKPSEAFSANRWGFTCDPRDAHVTMTYQGRKLIGEIVGIERHEVTGSTRFVVRHFNGEPWPLEPSIYAPSLEVLERR